MRDLTQPEIPVFQQPAEKRGAEEKDPLPQPLLTEDSTREDNAGPQVETSPNPMFQDHPSYDNHNHESLLKDYSQINPNMFLDYPEAPGEELDQAKDHQSLLQDYSQINPNKFLNYAGLDAQGGQGQLNNPPISQQNQGNFNYPEFPTDQDPYQDLQTLQGNNDKHDLKIEPAQITVGAGEFHQNVAGPGEFHQNVRGPSTPSRPSTPSSPSSLSSQSSQSSQSSSSSCSSPSRPSHPHNGRHNCRLQRKIARDVRKAQRKAQKDMRRAQKEVRKAQRRARKQVKKATRRARKDVTNAQRKVAREVGRTQRIVTKELGRAHNIVTKEVGKAMGMVKKDLARAFNFLY